MAEPFKGHLSGSYREIPVLMDIPKNAAERYAHDLYYRVHNAYKLFFPQMYVDPQISAVHLNNPPSSPIDKPIKDDEPMNAGSFIHKDKTILLTTGIHINDPVTAQFDLVKTPIESLKLRRRVVDTITIGHEFAHAEFEKIANQEFYDVSGPVAVDFALQEGFAVFMHTLFIDMINQNPHVLGFDQTDLEHLQKYKLAYLRMIKKPEHLVDGPVDIEAFIRDPEEYTRQHTRPIDSPYAQGTYRIFHRIYQEAAGSVTQRDVVKGLEAIKEFIQSVDRTKTRTLLRTDPEYMQILETGTITDLKAFLSNKDRDSESREPLTTSEIMVGINGQHLNSEDSITADNVTQIEQDLRTLPPMTEQTDTLLRNYFLYITNELQKLLGDSPFPLQFYKGEVHNKAEAKELYYELITNFKELVGARGREHTGPLGAYFWETSPVKDLEIGFATLGKTLGDVDLKMRS